MKKLRNTSWERSAKWYNKIVGTKGHFFHETIVLPSVLRLLNLQKNSRLLDIGCGQGILAKKILPEIEYTGADLSRSLISIAQKSDKNPRHAYYAADATKQLPFKNRDFTHAAAILSLQNMENADGAIRQAAYHLREKGRFVIVLNHPCFRIPRQSGWEIGKNKIQYRYVNRYMSSMKIPILMHPGETHSDITWTFHQPLSYYAGSLRVNGFLIETIEEWISQKTSQGKAAKMENLARSEIPLFLVISAIRFSI